MEAAAEAGLVAEHVLIPRILVFIGMTDPLRPQDDGKQRASATARKKAAHRRSLHAIAVNIGPNSAIAAKRTWARGGIYITGGGPPLARTVPRRTFSPIHDQLATTRSRKVGSIHLHLPLRTAQSRSISLLMICSEATMPSVVHPR